MLRLPAVSATAEASCAPPDDVPMLNTGAVPVIAVSTLVPTVSDNRAGRQRADLHGHIGAGTLDATADGLHHVVADVAGRRSSHKITGHVPISYLWGLREAGISQRPS